ncbi:4'-phosphopantetheinyl transferase [Oleidesulfovibrio alaskensis G20]|uniref:4'-phosphopantetheinyl transferase n=1 Tax=Oleidesulfovibrio alaskensis (strain ATCC BAA-1058 / DSM 17464 / G20) TaxID=207559 RepID=Q311J5_OLEA2|nr:4'-phosphopantetheinyl transferase [Oleidesulfovibrio alaskensis G20]
MHTCSGHSMQYRCNTVAVARSLSPDIQVFFSDARHSRWPEDSYYKTLSEHEKNRMAALATTQLKEQYLFAHGVKRLILGRKTHCAPERLGFGFSRFGKPFLAHPATSLQFNMSHSGPFCMLGISAESQIGVDIEIHSHSISYHTIIENYFSPTEIAIWKKTNPANSKKAFYRLWTLKEAVFKCIGSGLLIPLNGITITLTGGHSAIAHADNGLPLPFTLLHGHIHNTASWAVAVRNTSKEPHHVPIH